jgi:methionyl-tRNA formyltransferase
MRALLVTSQVTFVPRNYDDLIVGLADCPQVAGLLVLANDGWHLMAKAVALIALGARRVGGMLVANQWGRSHVRRRCAYAAHGKPVWSLPTINHPTAARLIAEQRIDLVVNARTRQIYRPDILTLPRLGCLNIHHGLLPDQRGTMCDLWALHERVPAGFSVHQMTARVDAGPILARVEASAGADRDYLRYLAETTRRELAELRALLAQIERQDAVAGQPNVPGPGLVYRRNPTRVQLRAMKKGGLLL